MSAPFDKETASTEDKIAYALCQIIDDNAPLQWTRYRGVAICIARNTELMDNLQELAGTQLPALAFFEKMKNACLTLHPQLNTYEPFTSANRFDQQARHIFVKRCDWAINLLIAGEAGGIYGK